MIRLKNDIFAVSNNYIETFILIKNENKYDIVFKKNSLNAMVKRVRREYEPFLKS